MKTVTLMNDDSPENPADFRGAWKLYSFSRKFASFEDPENFFPDGKPSIGLRRKLDTGLAFVLSYFEHGNCVWSRKGTGPQCQWDNVQVAGILIWEHKPKDMGAKSYDDRAKDADGFLEMYTCWCNGEVYGYSVEEEVMLPCGHTETKFIDSCFGFYGNDMSYMAEQIREALDGETEFEIKGEASDILDKSNLLPGVK